MAHGSDERRTAPGKQLFRIGDYLTLWARRAPDREAAVFGDRRISYAQLSREVDRCARALLAHGIRQGDRVAMLSTPRPEYMIVFLASLKVGAVWVGMNPVHRFEEHRFVLNDCRPRLIFAFHHLRGEDMRDLLRELRQALPFLERLVVFDGADAGNAEVTYDAFAQGRSADEDDYLAAVSAVELQDPAIIVYTSGTTGRPKGAVLTQRNIARCATTQLKLVPVTSLRALCNLPISHTVSSSEIVSYALAGGGTVIFQERFDPHAVLAAVERERITFLLQISAMFQQILAAADSPRIYDTSSLQAVLFLGAPLARGLIARLAELGGTVFTGWGLTESTTSATLTEAGDGIDVLADTVGRPTPIFDVRLATPAGEDVPAGGVGEILVRGECVMAGYYGLPDATAETIDPAGWLRSGDLGRFDEAGRLRLVGRIKEMFKSGGYNVYPREIEIALESHPAVALAAVVAIPDPLFVEVGCAFVVPRADASLGTDDMAAHCRARLANYKIPKRFVIRDRLPMLPLGKVDKATLRTEAIRLAEVTAPRQGSRTSPPARAGQAPRTPARDAPSSDSSVRDP